MKLVAHKGTLTAVGDVRPLDQRRQALSRLPQAASPYPAVRDEAPYSGATLLVCIHEHSNCFVPALRCSGVACLTAVCARVRMEEQESPFDTLRVLGPVVLKSSLVAGAVSG